jgi:short subunit fatty acids transporter
MKTLLFIEKQYRNSFILCFLTVFFTNAIVIVFFPRPTIDYETYFGGNYLVYSLLNISMFMSFILCIIILGLLIAERVLMERGYHEIIQKEKTGKDNQNN